MTPAIEDRPENADTYGLDAYRIETFVPPRLVEDAYGGRALARMAAGRLVRKLSGGRRGRSPAEGVVASYAGLAVFHRAEHHRGGLAFGQDFPRMLNELGIGRCKRLLELCSGPGYIGYALLAAGWCEHLVLTDIDAGAISSARRTAAHNGIEDRVSAYVSDALDEVPASERWDLVVANPPHFLPDSSRAPDAQVFDPDWSLHRRFYGSVKPYMRPGGRIVMCENAAGSDPGVFAEMIRSGGGQPITVHVGRDVRGKRNGLYYQVSEW